MSFLKFPIVNIMVSASQIIASSWKKGRNVCFYVGMFLMCCYSRDTGAMENKALIFEVSWVLW